MKEDSEQYPQWRKVKCTMCKKIFSCRNPNCRFNEIAECYCDKCTKTFSDSDYGCEFRKSLIKKLNPSRRDLYEEENPKR